MCGLWLLVTGEVDWVSTFGHSLPSHGETSWSAVRLSLVLERPCWESVAFLPYFLGQRKSRSGQLGKLSSARYLFFSGSIYTVSRGTARAEGLKFVHLGVLLSRCNHSSASFVSEQAGVEMMYKRRAGSCMCFLGSASETHPSHLAEN